jgi:hypothetical protein
MKSRNRFVLVRNFAERLNYTDTMGKVPSHTAALLPMIPTLRRAMHYELPKRAKTSPKTIGALAIMVLVINKTRKVRDIGIPRCFCQGSCVVFE